MDKKSKIVITYGTFDLFHYGHYNLLKRAKDLGDFLIVGVSSDKMCNEKGKIPVLSQVKRMEIISNLKFVDMVILEDSFEQKINDVQRFGVNVFCLGDDYREVFPKMAEYPKLLEVGCDVVFLERTPDISTSILKHQFSKH